MTLQSIWREAVAIRFSETDFQSNWKPAAFFSAMQEAGSHHASHLGYDYRDMFSAGMSWVLARAIIRFDGFPQAGETVEIETWPKGFHNKLFFMRDFYIRTEKGNQLAAASCAFVLIDLKARRILPLRVLKGELPDNQGRSAIAEIPDKLSIPEGLEEKMCVQAAYSDIDLMGHVNNTRYVEWVCDCFPAEFYQQHGMREIQVNFLNEVKAGEKVSIRVVARDEEPLVSLVAGKNLDSGAAAFEAVVKWKSGLWFTSFPSGLKRTPI